MAKGLFHGLLDLLFPPRCVFCRRLLREGERTICDDCEKKLPYTTRSDAVSTGGAFEKCVSPLLYEGVVQNSLLRFKFAGRTNYAGCYGRMMADCVKNHLAGCYDLITWVPLSARRKKKRGYDQAMLLALATALELEDVALETLRKREDTPAQSSLKGSERRGNVAGVYETVCPELIAGKRILLIDDIITTGSTLSECSKVLMEAGAAQVVCVTLAKSPKTAGGKSETGEAAADGRQAGG